MKFFALLALFAVSSQVRWILIFFDSKIKLSSSQITAQRSEFVDYLLDLQYIVDPVHDAIAAFYAEARATLSVDLTELNDEAVSEITQGLRAVIAIRDRTEEAVAVNSTPENEVCINEAIVNWTTDLETVGAAIQACADAHVDPIYQRTEDIHLYMQEHNKLAFDAQNMVLNVFTHVSEVTSCLLKNSSDDTYS